ncbi:MAG: Rieske (2Fe-2S) protein [Hyphomicrobiales bacterium]
MTDSNEWMKACPLDTLPVGEKTEAKLSDGTMVMIAHLQSGLFACCADCPHLDTPLVEADIDGDVLTCPTHFWQWKIPTGEAMGVSEMPLPVYEVKTEDDFVWVRKPAG